MSFRQVLKSTTPSWEQVVWLFPVTLTAGWLVFPALDTEWKISMGLAEDPRTVVRKVQADRQARLDRLKAAKGGSFASSKAKASKEEEEEEDEPEEEEEQEPENEEGGGDDDEEEDKGEEEEEEEAPEKAPKLFVLVKGKKLKLFEQWDNFTIKSINMSDEDDDDDEDDEE